MALKFHKQKKLSFSLLLLLFAFVLAAPLLLRMLHDVPITPLEESYEMLVSPTGAYGFLLSHWMSPLLPVLLGLISFIAFYALLKRRQLENDVIFYALLLFAITPVTITAFTTHTAIALFTPLVLLSFLWVRLAPLFLLAALFCSPIAAVIIIFLVAAYRFIKKDKTSGLLALTPLVFVPFVSFMSFSLFLRAPLFGEFGSIMGYSIFIFLLGLVGVVRSWKTINASWPLLWFVLFLMSAYVVELRVLLLGPLVVYASKELSVIVQSNWDLDLLKQASIILLFCLGLFVFLTHSQALANAQPQAGIIHAITLANEDSRTGNIFAPEDVDSIVQYYTPRHVVSISTEDPLWNSVRISEVGPFITRNDIRFLIFPSRLHDEGFFFLISHNEKFITVSQETDYELWLVLQEFVR